MTQFHTQQNTLTINEILNVDEMLSTLPGDDFDAMGRILQSIAERLMPVDACYVCLYHEESQKLSLPYNFDNHAGDPFDSPCMRPIPPIPLGCGPSSQVIRTKSSYVLDRSDRTVQDGGVNWGACERVSESALHVPITADGLGGMTQFLGVFSVQSYTPDVYGPNERCFIEWLGRKAGQTIADFRAKGTEDSAACEIARLKEELNVREITMVNAFVSLFPELSAAISSLEASSHFSGVEQKQGLRGLALVSRKIQAKTTCLHFSIPRSSDNTDELFDQMSDREKEIIPLLMIGMTYKQIGETLSISVNTVKFHVGSIFSQLNIERRTQIQQRLSQIRSTPVIKAAK